MDTHKMTKQFTPAAALLSAAIFLCAGSLLANGSDRTSQPPVATVMASASALMNTAGGSHLNRAVRAAVWQTTIINGGVLNGKAISLPKPPYPRIALVAHASGTVVVQVTVGEDGNVISAVAVNGHPLLRAAAVSAARRAKFSPTTVNGVPVKVTGSLIYEFTIPVEPKDEPPVASAGRRRADGV